MAWLDDAGECRHLRKSFEDRDFPRIAAKNIPGYQAIELLRRDVGGEVEFITQMRFDSLQSVLDFQGEDYEAAYVPEKARAVLKRFDERSQHYEIRARFDYGAAPEKN